MSRTPSPNRRGSTVVIGSEGPTHDVSGSGTKHFLNGWTEEQENLMAQWADVAACYRWLHYKSEKLFSRMNMAITIPVIVLSTLTGTASFASGTFVPGDHDYSRKAMSAVIGSFSILAGILTTLGNFLRYAQNSEAHRVASIGWGKFQRFVAVELAIQPDERIEAMDFLKICRQDLDRLIEQSPPIEDTIVKKFQKEFKETPNLKMPDICHGIEHTHVYDSSKLRVSKVTADAAVHFVYQKKIIQEAVLPRLKKELEKEIGVQIDKRLEDALREEVKEEETNKNKYTVPIQVVPRNVDE